MANTALGRWLPAELVLLRAVSIPPDAQEILASRETKLPVAQMEVWTNDCPSQVAGQPRDAVLLMRAR